MGKKYDPIFPGDEPQREKLPSGTENYPRPKFVQPDTGVHNATEGAGLTVETNPTSTPHVSSEPEDLDGGYYGG